MAEKCLPSFSLTHMILWSVVHFTATKTRYRANKSVLYTERKPGTQKCFAAKNAADFHACVWVPSERHSRLHTQKAMDGHLPSISPFKFEAAEPFSMPAAA